MHIISFTINTFKFLVFNNNKFKMSKIIIKLEFNEEIHKLPRFPQTYSLLLQAIEQSFKGKLPKAFILKYRDVDNDMITLSDDHDYQTAISFLESENIKSFKILISAIQSQEAKENIEIVKESPMKEEKKCEFEEKKCENQENKQEISKTEPTEIQRENNEKLIESREEKKNSVIFKEEPLEYTIHVNEQPEVKDEKGLDECIKEPSQPVDVINEKPNPVELIEKPEPIEVLIEKPQPVEVLIEKPQPVEVLIDLIEKPQPVEVKPVEPVIEEKPVEVTVEKLELSEIDQSKPDILQKKLDLDDFSDLETIVKALKSKMEADGEELNKKAEPHSIDNEFKTLNEQYFLQDKDQILPSEILFEKKEEIIEKPIKPIEHPLQEDKEVQSSKEIKLEEEKQIQTESTEKKEDKEKKNRKKLENIQLFKEFMDVFCETHVVFDIPCYKCKNEKKIWSFTCKKCNDTGIIRVDTHNPKYTVFNKIIREKINRTHEKFLNVYKSLKKKASIEEKMVLLQNAYFCVSCRAYPIKGKNYICDTCLNFAYCEACHENQYHPHALKVGIYEPDMKKREKMFSLQNIEHSPKAEKPKEKPYKATIIEPPKALFEYEPAKPVTIKYSFKNTGNKVWPDKLKIECVEGAYKGLFDDVQSLKINEIGSFEIYLQAMKEPGKYESKWKLAYDEGNERKYFGPKISFEIVVFDPELKKNQPGVEWKDKGNFFY